MATASCPVCREQFDTPMAFALHVATCTAPVDSGSPLTPAAAAAAALAKPMDSCPTCHMVFTTNLASHEIAFHKEECERMNAFVGPVLPIRLDANGGLCGDGSGGSTRPSSGSKRARDSHTDVAATTAAGSTGPNVKLYPAHCAVCDAGGRTLLHCAGKCARSFHPLCIEEINTAREFAASGTATILGSSATGGGSHTAAHVSFATAITRDKKAQKAWVCGECTRGLHLCQLCGFLGHEGHEIVRCSLPDCGFFFHPACLRDQNLRAQSPLVCPRHTCTGCHAIETDMSVCASCTKCCKSIHIRCQDAGGDTTTAVQSRARGDVMDPNFYECDAHKPQAAETVVTPERKTAQHVGLKLHCRPGDLVLILEYGNLLLPSSAKAIAPAAFNQWGIVQRVENLGDGVSSAWWTQLLTVALFSDSNVISVPNRYVLPIGSMRSFSTPTHMIRDAIKWHAMSEIHARHMEQRRSDGPASTFTPSSVLADAILAFKERAKALGLTSADCLADAGDGFAAWQQLTGSSSQTYAKTSAPVYIALDTRGQHKPDMEIAAEADRTPKHTQGPHQGTGADDDDVEMDDSSSASGGGTDTGGAAGTPLSGSIKSGEAANAVVDEVVGEVMARVLESVEAQVTRGSLKGGGSQFQVDTMEEVTEDVFDDTIEEDSEGDNEEDIAMAEVAALPPLGEEEDGSDSGQDGENRLSMDDLLNPMSQESLASPDLKPLKLSSGEKVEERLTATPLETPSDQVIDKLLPDVDPQSKKRSWESSEDKFVNGLDSVDKNGSRPQYPTAKKPKLMHDSSIAVKFSHLPMNLKAPRGSVFGRAPLPVPPTLMHKEKVATEYPSAMLEDLQRRVDAFFEAEDDYDRRHLKSLSSFRPVFYRPTPFLYRSTRVGRRLDLISRVLLCQDKRNLKCFVREGTSSSSKRTCPYDSVHHGRLSFVSLDLIGIPNFATLEKEVRSRVANAVATKERSAGWHWQSSTGTSVTVEEELREPEIRLTYCAYDGSEHALPRQKLHRQQQPEWLCFCANVVHLTATVIQH